MIYNRFLSENAVDQVIVGNKFRASFMAKLEVGLDSVW